MQELAVLCEGGSRIARAAPRQPRLRASVSLTICLLLICLAARSTTARTRETERGVPYLTNYEPKIDNESIGYQNWAAVQDPRGVMYFGNTAGVVEYDGVEWRLLSLPGRSTVRSLAVDAQGTVFVGGQGTFGFLAPGPRGALTYIPLEQRVADEDRHFADVWKVHVRRDGVYFQTFSHLFRWDGTAVTSLRAEPQLHFSFADNNELYVKQDGVGLLKVAGDELRPVAGGGEFADDRVYTILPLGENSVLVGTRERGLWRLHRDGSAEPFATEADRYLAENQLYHGVLLHSGWMALATLRGGTVIIDREGSLQEILDRRIGLQDSTVTSVFVDRDGGLWMTMDRNVSRVETPAQLSTYSERNGLVGAVQSILRHDGQLYVATTQGVYRLRPPATDSGTAPSVVPSFTPINDIATQSWKLVSVGATVLAATNDGVYAIRGSRARRISTDKALTLLPSRLHPERVYVGLFDGLATVERDGSGRWVRGTVIDAVDDQVRTIAEHANGALWLGVLYRGLLRVEETAAGSWTAQPLTNEASALPPGYGRARVFSAGEEILVGTDIGLYRVDDATRSLQREPSSADRLEISWEHRLANERHDQIWLVSGAGSGVGAALRRPDGSFYWEYMPFDRIPARTVWEVLAEPDGVVWFGTSTGLIRFAPDVVAPSEKQRSTLIRSVTAPGPTPVFRGVHVGPNGEARTTQYLLPSLRPHANDLRFEYATPCYGAERSMLHQTRLRGYDTDWSVLSTDTVRTYTNLPPGSYTFQARAQVHGGGLSEPAQFRFSILPQWYRTWWALSLFALLGGAAIVASAHAYAVWTRRSAHTQAEHRRRASELWHARQIQRNLLPSSPPVLERLDIAAVHLTATEVGGDYYDFFPQDDGTLFAAIGDATGHGLGAGLMVSATKTALLTVSSSSLESIAHQLNKVLRQVHLGKRLNMALTLLALDPDEGGAGFHLTASGGGMAPMYILRSDGTVDERIVAGVPLGALDIAEYSTLTDYLVPNDTLVLMSDGVPERQNGEGEVLDYEGVQSILLRLAQSCEAADHTVNAATILEAILDACHRWAGRHDVNDDLTLVVIKVLPSAPRSMR